MPPQLIFIPWFQRQFTKFLHASNLERNYSRTKFSRKRGWFECFCWFLDKLYMSTDPQRTDYTYGFDQIIFSQLLISFTVCESEWDRLPCDSCLDRFLGVSYLFVCGCLWRFIPGQVYIQVHAGNLFSSHFTYFHRWNIPETWKGELLSIKGFTAVLL